VLGTIVQKPGIYQSNIHRRLSLVMSRCEIEDVLDELVHLGAVNKKVIVKPPKVSLFSKPRDFVECDFEDRWAKSGLDRDLTDRYGHDFVHLKVLRVQHILPPIPF
ncbi:9581_t:CDS:2, partial [Acaulospora morrowiae]